MALVKITKDLKVLTICFSQYVDRNGEVVTSISAMRVNRDTAYSCRKYSQNYRERLIGDMLYVFYGSYLASDRVMTLVIEAYLAGKFTKFDTGDWN